MRLPITLAVLAATAFAPSLAMAEPAPAPTPHANGIIAILIGQFTPPIGSNKGS